jgi:SAM-dependent methyltransferase
MTALKMFKSYEEQFELMEKQIKALARGKRSQYSRSRLRTSLAAEARRRQVQADRRDLDEEGAQREAGSGRGDRGDLRTADLGGRKFDVVYSSYVLEHVPNAALALENLYRWLKPGGLLILRFPDRNTAFGFTGRFTPFWLHVAYHKYILRRWNAGKPGFGPYPTYYDWIVSREGLRDFCASHRLRVREEYGLSDFHLERTVGTRLALAVSILVALFRSGGCRGATTI